MTSRSRWRSEWREAWRLPRFRVDLVLAAIALAGSLLALSRYLRHVERRPGVVLPDPILASFPAVDLTWFTFGLIYGGILLGIVVLVRHPRILVDAMRAYALVCLLRFGMMALAPLDPPAGHLPLADPFVEGCAGSGGRLTKDLFFSGHFGLAFLLFLVAPGRALRALFLGIALAVGVAVLAQHVHYTIDVAVAPFVTYACVRLAPLLALCPAPDRAARTA